MTTTLLRIGANAAAANLRRALSSAGRERGEAVEEDLRHEAAQPRRWRARAARRPVGPSTLERVDAHDQRREHDAHDGDDEQRDGGDRDDRVRGLFVVSAEVAHEQREQGRGEDAAEEQLVEDVRRLVRVRVDAGDLGGPERVRDRGDAPEPGEP